MLNLMFFNIINIFKSSKKPIAVQHKIRDKYEIFISVE